MIFHKDRKDIVRSFDNDANFFDIVTGVLQGDTMVQFLL